MGAECVSSHERCEKILNHRKLKHVSERVDGTRSYHVYTSHELSNLADRPRELEVISEAGKLL